MTHSRVQGGISLLAQTAALWPLCIALAVVWANALGGNNRIASADGVVLLHPNPLSASVVNGQVVSVDVLVENVQNLYGAQVYLQFDPAVVAVVDAASGQAGVQVSAGTWLKPDFVQANQADNTLGTIDYVVTELSPTPAVSGSGILCTIRFRAKVSGQQTLVSQRASPPTILAVVVGPQTTAPTLYQWQDGLITVEQLGPHIYYFPVIRRSP